MTNRPQDREFIATQHLNGQYRYILLDTISEEDFLLIPMAITKLHEKHSEQIPDIALRNRDNFDETVMQPLQRQFKYCLDSNDKCYEILEEITPI